MNWRQAESRSALPRLQQEEVTDLQAISQNARSWSARQKGDRKDIIFYSLKRCGMGFYTEASKYTSVLSCCRSIERKRSLLYSSIVTAQSVGHL